MSSEERKEAMEKFRVEMFGDAEAPDVDEKEAAADELLAGEKQPLLDNASVFSLVSALISRYILSCASFCDSLPLSFSLSLFLSRALPVCLPLFLPLSIYLSI